MTTQQDATFGVTSATTAEATIPSSPDNGAQLPQRQSVPLSRETILDATSTCLREVGYDGTTIRKIARTLGCAVGSIYRYYTDKRELLAAVCERRFDAAAQVVEAGGSVQQSAAAYIEAANDSPEIYRLMFWLASVGQKEATSEVMLPAIVNRLIAGWATRLSHQDAARRAWLTLHGLIMLGEPAEAIETQLRQTIDGIPQAGLPISRPASMEQRDKAVASESQVTPADIESGELATANVDADDVTML